MTTPTMRPMSPACTAFRDEPAVRYVAEADGGGEGVFPDGTEPATGLEAPSPVTPSKEEAPTKDTVSSSWFSRVILATGPSILEG